MFNIYSFIGYTNNTAGTKRRLQAKNFAGRAAERARGARGKILFGARGKLILFGAPMTSLFSNNKTKNRLTVLQRVENTSKRGL